jgi:hypothetical protein
MLVFILTPEFFLKNTQFPASFWRFFQRLLPNFMNHKGTGSKGASSFRRYEQNYSKAMKQGNSMCNSEGRGHEKTGSTEGR